MKSLKKLMTIVMAMAMMFAFASTAMAAEAGFYVNGVKQDVTITDGQSVYDVVKAWAGNRAEWKEVASDIGDGTGWVLVSLDGDGSVPYESKDLEPYEYYDFTVDDPTLARVNAALLAKYPDSDGLGLWMGNGVGYSNDGPYMAYVGDDWTFTVNGERPVDKDDPSVELYMNQATVDADDVIALTYGEVIEVWNYQE